MELHQSVCRHLGVPVPAEVVDALDARLLEHWVGDHGALVDAHLAINYPYFGAIDKSLTGFVVLDDEGDDYTLLDARGDGRVWWQDHETRELEPRFASFEDWRAYRAELARAASEEDARSEYEIREALRPLSFDAGTGPAPSSAVLAQRYQWLVWLLAQPLLHHGKPMQSAEDLTANAARHFRACWEGAEVGKALDVELPLLHRDPHLAIYWLLHTALLAQHTDRTRVLAEIARAEQRPALLESFAEVLGGLGVTGDVPVVPEFRVRRALLLEHLAEEDDEQARAALIALEMAPDHTPLDRASWVIGGLDEAALTIEQVHAVLARMPETTGTALLRADADRRAGRDHSPAADTLVRLLPVSDSSWPARLWAVTTVLPLIRDGEALAEAARELLVKDPYSRPCLTLLRRAHELCGTEPVLTRTELDRRWITAEASSAYLERLRAADSAPTAVLTELDGTDLGEVVAQRILLRADIDRSPAEAIAWALHVILAGTHPDRADLAATGLRQLPAQDRARTVEGLRVDTVADPVVPVLIRLLEHTPEPDAADILGEMANDKLKKAACLALAPVAHEPAVFDELLRLAALPAPASTVEALCEQLLNPNTEHCVLPRVSAEQAVRAAAALIDTVATHPGIAARNAAGHQLYRFRHPGAQDYLIAALDDYGRRYAESDPTHSPVLSHGRTEDDQLGEVVANLYSAVRQCDSETSRAALIERVFAERRSIWRMGNALGEIFSPQVHQEIMRRLRAQRDARAAAHYANALTDHVKSTAPRVELLREISAWPIPTDATVRRVFKYALSTGIVAALETGDFDLVRTAYASRAVIAADAAEPDMLSRGRSWADPLDTGDPRTRLADALSGEADSARDALLGTSAQARATGRALTRIGDADLATLAGAPVRRRLLTDRSTGEVWYLDPDGGFHTFDGFGLRDNPFRPSVIGYYEMREFLDAVNEQSERALLWTAAGNEFLELVRYLDRVVYRWGTNNGRIDTVGLVFADPSTAENAFARMKATGLAAKHTESDPWYLPGRAAIMRTFQLPDIDSERLMAFDRLRFAVVPEDAVAHERRELDLYRAGAGLSCLEWVTWHGYRVRAELTVAEWIRARIRDDRQDAAWHVNALAEIATYLAEHGFTTHSPGLHDLRVEVGAPAAPEDIAALEAELGAPLPARLRTLWQHVGHAEWRCGDTGMRLLAPAEVRRNRARMQQLGARYVAALGGAHAAPWEPVLSSLSALVLDLDGTLDTVFSAVAPSSDDRVFAHMDQQPMDAWWEKSLSWILATSFLSGFARHLEQSAPEITMLFGGQRRGPELTSRYFEAPGSSGTKFWEICTDPTLDTVATRHGKAGTAGTVSTKRHGDPAKAAAYAAKTIAAKQKSGYREITH
ncbi:WGR domain-containing protein [Nocardia sp. 2]|uniref:WGR domain-containing protein n=1 Tax=Nocardia acididurans TaxID=2802282 RepID=A0ABS1M8B7_9NOCA|nr:WGR domain-containing protein [Nocardia acididurans]MBL1076888.1 WGR domain-containing protein [Nocardia acididurans]